MHIRHISWLFILMLASSLVYGATPQVTSTNPTSGPTGTQVQVNGNGFGTTQGTSTVNIGGQLATVVNWSDTLITARVSPNAVTGVVFVTAGGVSSNTTIYFNIPSPQITSITPNSGAVNTQVTIAGSGFQATRGTNSSVAFNGVTATIVSWSDTQIVATVQPRTTSGPVMVSVNGVGSNENAFFTMPNPVVATVTPTSGPTGTAIQVNGSGFGASQGTSVLQINGINATIATWSDVQISATIPTTATSGLVTVNVGGVTSTSDVNFTIPAPQVTSVSPSSGVANTRITVSGSGFQATKGSSSTLSINGINAAITTWSDTQIVATVPSSPTSGPVKVAVNSVSSNADILFTVPSPVVTGVSPSAGPEGAQIQINGRGFGATQGSSSFTLGGQTAPVVNWSDNQIVTSVPPAAGTGAVLVTVSNIASPSTVNFTVTPPRVTSISPASGLVGTTVTINGLHFGATQTQGMTNGTRSSVFFNGASASVVSWSDSQIVVTVPNTATTGPVTISGFAGNSNADVVFTMPNPVISSVAPSSAAVKTQVQINGSGFGTTQGSSSLKFYSNNTASIVTWSDSQIVATVPTTALSGPLSILVGGISSNNNINFSVPPPHVSSVSPTSGVIGSSITVTGSGFQDTRGSSSINFSSGQALTVVTWSDTQIVATVPTNSTTGGIYVTVNGVQSNQDNVLTLPNPVISSLSAIGAPVGGTVQINGTGFGASQGSNTITLNFINMPVSSWSDTSITATVPTGATSNWIRVTVGGVVASATLQVSNVNINSFSPLAGPTGTAVTINGSGFGGTQGASVLRYNNVAITPTSWSDSQIVANVPSGASSASFGVTVGAVSVNTPSSFQVNNIAVNSVTPSSAPVGAQVQIAGKGFGATQGTSWVNLGGQSATVGSWSDTLITATVPRSAGNNLNVVVGGVFSNTAPFTTVHSAITSISPTTGPAGTQVTITGSNFGATQGSTSVLNFTGATATGATWSDTSITVQVPSGAFSGAVYTTVGGLNSNQNINFTVPTPLITSISPTSGMVQTQVTVNGSGFLGSQGGSSLRIGGAVATIVSWSDSQIVAKVVSGAKTGPVQVLLGSSISSNLDQVFSMPNPVVSSISPAVGQPGTLVQINGSGFGATQGTSTLGFFSKGSGLSNVMATPSSWSDTVITAQIPAGATSGPILVNAGGVTSIPPINVTIPPPQVISISPATGVPGTQITIAGANFNATQGSGSVRYNNGNPLSIVSWSDTQIVGTIQASGNTGALKVTQTVDSNTDVVFTYINPVITSISPSSGAVGTQVQINGSGFGATQGASTINFSNVPATVVTWSDTQIVATVSAANKGGQVTVVIGGITSNSNINFTVPAPQITSITPATGTVGATVTIAGSGFQTAAGSGHLFFNLNQPASIVSWSDTQIVAQVPPSATRGGIYVTANNANSSNQNVMFTMPNPIVTGVSPTAGPGGTQVQVNGSGFGALQGTSTITIGSVSATVVSWSDAQIVALVPTTVGNSAPIQVAEGGVLGNSNVFFTVTAPVITGISPTIGGPGNPVTITGAGFESAQGQNSQVIISGTGATVKSWTDTQVVAIVPPSAGTGSVRVLVNSSPSNYVTYTVPPFSISSISPAVGPVGTQVTLQGVGFGGSQGTSVVSFNGQPASVSSWSDTQIVATVPVTAISGPAVVTINNVNSNATNTFTVPPPFVSSLTPQGGIAGTSVTIVGGGFQANQRNSIVTFNGVPATVSSWSDSQIVASVPAGATTGQVTVTVNSVAGSSPSFEVPHPVIASISRSEAPASGTITVTGSGFGPGYMTSPDGIQTIFVGWVEVNGIAGGIVSWSDTSITTQLPSNATSGTLTVVKYDTTSNGVPITIEGAPAVATLSPAMGPVNASIVINGSNFGDQQYDSTIQFSGINATVTSWSDSQVTALVPPGDYTGPVNITVAGVPSSTQNFTVSTAAQVTDSLGNSTTYTSIMVGGTWSGSDSQGAGCSSCTVRGTIHSDHDALGNVTASTDELLRVTNFTYDANNNVASSTAHLDASTPVTTSYTYNSFGEPLTVTDPLGNVTTNTYDGNGNLLTVTSPAPNGTTAASVTQFAYDTKGELTQITDPLSHITTLSYYPTGLIHTITDAQSNITSYEYDQRGNRTAVVDAQQNRTTFAYDAGDRLTGITYPDSTSVGFAYDSRGRRTSVTDQNGKVTSYAYDDADRLTSVTDAASNVTSYSYDTENNLLSITDANNHTTSFAYDAFGRVTQTTFPSTLVESYVYDALGNLTSKTDRKNQTITYLYDALNRLTHKGYPDNTGVDYVYDLVGKIKEVTDPTGTYGFAYDNMGRLVGTTTQYAFLPGQTYTNSYTYDAASNRISFTAPDGSTNTYAYDTLGRLSTLNNSLAGQFGFSYDNLSRRTQLTRPNGVDTNYSYDSLSNLLSVLHQAGTNTIDGASYLYDNVGNRTSKTNYLNNVTENYTYDPLYQLTQVTQGATTTESYSYDPVGNRLSSLGMPSYAYNSSNELTSTSAATFTYDNNGNTRTKTDSSGTTTYNWNFENRLTSVVLPGTGGTVSFAYDPSGRRIQKSSTSGTTDYLYDGSNSVAEADQTGSILAHFAQDLGIDQPLAELKNSTIGYYQQDAVGSVTALNNSSGTLLDSYTYDSFGNVSASTGSFLNQYSYTARDTDSETGLRSYRARYYSADIGRFLSEDPIQFAAGVDFYSYVLNNPVRWVDPTGMKPGDKYSSCQNAAFDAFRDIFLISMREGVEYAGRLYWNWDGTCSYTAPHKGTKDRSNAGSCPWLHKGAGTYHTHPRIPGYDYEHFSYDDTFGDNYNNEPGYLATPSGKVWVHNPGQDPIQIGTIEGRPGTFQNKPSPGKR